MSSVLDTAYGLTIVLLATLLLVTYVVRVRRRGSAHDARIEAHGAKTKLGKNALEMGYWGIRPIANGLVSVGITPNAITYGSLVLGMASGVALGLGFVGAGALLALASAVGDSLDGLVARATGVCSDAGEVLDATVDRYTEGFFLAGFGVLVRGDRALLALAFFGLIGSFMVSYSTAKSEAMGVPPASGGMRRPERAAYLITGAAFASLGVRWAPPGLSLLPLVAAVGLVALVSNVSAVQRMRALAIAVAAREAKKRAEATASDAEARDPVGAVVG